MSPRGRLSEPFKPRAAQKRKGLVADPMALEKENPENGRLNVEGAASWWDGLLLGLRDPLVKRGGALVVEIENPRVVAAGCDGGRGVRVGRVLVVPAKHGEEIRAMSEIDGSDDLLVVLGPTTHDEKERATTGDEDLRPYRIVRWSPTTQEIVKDFGPKAKWLSAGQLEGITSLGNGWLVAYDAEGRSLARSLRLVKALD